MSGTTVLKKKKKNPKYWPPVTIIIQVTQQFCLLTFGAIAVSCSYCAIYCSDM